MPDFAILGNLEKNNKNISFDNNLLNALNYTAGGNVSIFNILTNLNSNDLKKKIEASKILLLLNIESSELKNP
jgi:hypothetical protein